MRSFFFYDLETSGFSPRYDRIMQFAGIRTDSDFNQIGDPVNLLIKMTDDTLPSPGAILTTHITPQQTIAEGISEADFCRYFLDEIAKPETVMLGYNNVRFDDEFMRHTLWRNFHDPYEWFWAEGRSRWDLLDVTRMVRALRPAGINWPVKEIVNKDSGEKITVGTVNLVDMAKSNNFENKQAHDALADVRALINLAKLLKDRQPKMWGYLYSHRDKKSVATVVRASRPVPFVYTSGRYSSKYEKTSVAIVIGPGSSDNSVLVWDLRYDPQEFSAWSEEDILVTLTADYERRSKADFIPLPVKELSLNKCPAVAPLGTLDDDSQMRINLSRKQIEEYLERLKDSRKLMAKVVSAWHKKPSFAGAKDVEGQLYDSLIPDEDKTKIRLVAAASETELADLHPEFNDDRLSKLLLRYKARQYPRSLSEAEQAEWEKYRAAKLARELPRYLEELAKQAQAGADDFILQELQLWAESIVPVDY